MLARDAMYRMLYEINHIILICRIMLHPQYDKRTLQLMARRQ